MTSIKVKFRPSASPFLEGTIYYQVIHDRLPRQLSTPYRLHPEEWDPKRAGVIIPSDPSRKSRILSIRENIRLDIARLSRVIRRLDDSGIPFTADDICREFRRYAASLSLRSYMGDAITRLKDNGRISTSANYRSALASFTRFLSSKGESDIMLDCITPRLMLDYQAFLQSRGIVRNTTSFYMRQLRAVYNAAVDEGLIVSDSPFRKVYTGIDKTVKRAISLDALSGILRLDLSHAPKLDFARDMFLLSFFFRGMSFVDMAFLRKENIEGDYLAYSRRKTGQRLMIRLNPEMREILGKYPPGASGYMLPIVRSGVVDEYSAYKNMHSNVNRGLRKIGEMVGLPIKLTHYVARHSWASGAYASKVSVDLICEGMGHDNVNTTKIYLASLSTSGIDSVNDKLIRSLIK